MRLLQILKTSNKNIYMEKNIRKIYKNIQTSKQQHKHTKRGQEETLNSKGTKRRSLGASYLKNYDPMWLGFQPPKARLGDGISKVSHLMRYCVTLNYVWVGHHKLSVFTPT